MNKEVKETIKNLQNNELIKNGYYEFIGDSNITYAEIYILLKFIGDLQQKNKQLKDNWNKLKEYLKNDINNRNGNRAVEYEDSRKVSETISPIYTLMEDKSKTMKEILNIMQEIEQVKELGWNE